MVAADAGTFQPDFRKRLRAPGGPAEPQTVAFASTAPGRSGYEKYAAFE
jgi:hypothetical protein